MSATGYQRMYARAIGPTQRQVLGSAPQRADGRWVFSATVRVRRTRVHCGWGDRRLSLAVDRSAPGTAKPTRDRLRRRRAFAVYRLTVAGAGESCRVWLPGRSGGWRDRAAHETIERDRAPGRPLG